MVSTYITVYLIVVTSLPLFGVFSYVEESNNFTTLLTGTGNHSEDYCLLE
jgi:hypothetical protein